MFLQIFFPVVYKYFYLAAEQLERRERLSQKAESVSGLSVRPPLTPFSETFLSPEAACFMAASSEPELDLECEAEWIPRSVMVEDLSEAGDTTELSPESSPEPEPEPGVGAGVIC